VTTKGRRIKWAKTTRSTVASIVYIPTPAWPATSQVKSLRQYLKCSRHHFLRFFAELPIEFRVIVRAHTTLKHLRGGRSIKEAGCDAQCTDPVASGPYGTNLVGFANACHQHGARDYANCR
jgi:hypothetical protein